MRSLSDLVVSKIIFLLIEFQPSMLKLIWPSLGPRCTCVLLSQGSKHLSEVIYPIQTEVTCCITHGGQRSHRHVTGSHGEVITGSHGTMKAQLA